MARTSQPQRVISDPRPQMDPELVPFTGGGPVLTPPIADYDCPDGDYTDTTRKWE